jgi:cyclic pyranopterin phosphate synthase
MVDVTAKPVTFRQAVARGEILARPETVALAARGLVPKGNVLEAARIAGIMAAKGTGSIIPLCHPLGITGVDVSFVVGRDRIEVEVSVSTAGRTGVEMEALTGTSVALLTIYDMCKAVDKGMVISNVRLIQKTGGRGGVYVREEGGRRTPPPAPPLKGEGRKANRREQRGGSRPHGSDRRQGRTQRKTQRNRGE